WNVCALERKVPAEPALVFWSVPPSRVTVLLVVPSALGAVEMLGIETTPALIIVPPVQLEPLLDKVSTPPPSLVNVPLPMVMAELIVVLAAPPTVRLVPEPLMPPLSTRLPVVPSELIRASVASAIAPEKVMVPVVVVLRSAPALEMPVPLRVRGSAMFRLLVLR